MKGGFSHVHIASYSGYDSRQSAKLLFRFSLPLFLGNLLQQLYHLVDTAMAGHMLGDAALSQIGSTAALYSLITTLAFGLNSGFALTVSRHFGSGNKKSMERSVCWMILLSALCALVMTAVFFSARAWLVDAMQIPAVSATAPCAT